MSVKSQYRKMAEHKTLEYSIDVMSELLSFHGLSRRLDIAPLTLRKRIEAGEIQPVANTAGRLLFDGTKIEQYRLLFHRKPVKVSA